MSEMLSEEIKQFLPHRYPFLLVDRVTECVPGESLTAYKNVTVNEPFFQGHFPHIAIMPGVLIIEALAQATGLLGFRTMSEEPSNDLLYMLAGVDNGISSMHKIPAMRHQVNFAVDGMLGSAAYLRMSSITALLPKYASASTANPSRVQRMAVLPRQPNR